MIMETINKFADWCWCRYVNGGSIVWLSIFRACGKLHRAAIDRVYYPTRSVAEKHRQRGERIWYTPKKGFYITRPKGTGWEAMDAKSP